MLSAIKRAANTARIAGAIRVSGLHGGALPAIRPRARDISRPDASRHAAGPGPGRESPQSQNIIPGVPVLERLCAEVIVRAQRRLYRQLTTPLSEDKKNKVEG